MSECKQSEMGYGHSALPLGAEGGDLSCWQPGQCFLSSAERSPGDRWPLEFSSSLSVKAASGQVFVLLEVPLGFWLGLHPLTETGKLVMSTAVADTQGKQCWDNIKLLVCSP